MATVTASSGGTLDMSSGDFSDFNGGTVFSSSDTEVVVTGAVPIVGYTITGTGFAGDNGSGLPTEGTINSFETSVLGNPIETIAGFSMSWEKFLIFAGNDDYMGFEKRVLGGDDTITGDTQADIGKGYKGSDTLYGGAADDIMYGGRNGDALYGGDDNDTLYGGSGQDSFDGGAGTDVAILKGNYSGGYVFDATTLVGIETLRLGKGFEYNLTSDDANVAAGEKLTVNGAHLDGIFDNFTFDGSAETDGRFVVFDGAGSDTIIGGALNDIIHLENGGQFFNRATGGGGSDTIILGGSGSFDTVVIASGADSSSTYRDVVRGFNFNGDTFDTPTTVTDIEATFGVTMNSATFDSDVAFYVNDALVAGTAWFLNVTLGDLAGHQFMVVAVGGGDDYEAGTDIVVDTTGQIGGIDTGDFI